MNDILFGNNNNGAIRHLSRRYFRKNKIRNFAAVLAIFLTAFLFTDVYKRQKVFTPFYRVPETAGVNVPGTGIGLSLVYSIVKLHKGCLLYTSRCV